MSLELNSHFSACRCLKLPEPYERIELHTFVDGSLTAYASCSYLRFIYSNNVSVSLIASKSRVTPINNSTLKTVPRIELCSAKLGVNLARKLHSELTYKICEQYFWSDSTTVLHYIKCNDKRFQRFVTNKVCYIRNFSRPDNWYYVPTSDNPADLISRGSSVHNLVNCDIWIKGPAFLTSSTINFPVIP